MPDNLNTPYLSVPLSADNLNTPSLANTDSAATVNVLSVISYGNQQIFQGGVDLQSTVTLPAGDTANFAGDFNSTGTVDVASGVLLSRITTASADSTTVADGEMAVMESTNTNVTLIVRSGNTTYHFVSSAGSVG